MKYHYFISTEMQSVIEKEGYNQDILQRLQKFNESDKEIINPTPIIANLFLNKFKDGSRFVWIQEKRDDICFYILRRIYKGCEHDSVYLKEVNESNKELLKEKYQLTSNEKDELNANYIRLLEKKKKDFLPEKYRKYEGKRAFDRNKDVIFYEMPLWSNGMKRLPKNSWRDIQLALSEKIEHDYMQKGDFFWHTTPSGYTITFRYDSYNTMWHRNIYLLQIVKGDTPNWKKIKERKYDCEDAKRLQNISSKCYPDYCTYDYDVWKKIEEDDIANIALSDEEIKILQNVKFPFFVSGLAGSGKSTILYYLYANIYRYVAMKNPEQKLMFLSYNDSLIDKARQSVKSILLCHNGNTEFGKYFENNQNLIHFENSFVSFQKFIKNKFLDEQSIFLFDERKHITYERFRELYETEYMQPGNKLSPSILWSVIRSFIKGRNLDIFTPNDYMSDVITRGDRTIDYKTYEEAYRIWNTWYRKYNEERGYWDDLDLVRFVLRNGNLKNAYHGYFVLFCDEAQDFTKLEIDLILKLSKHSEYDLSEKPEDVRIPIAFAGDPNQTISPTGFRWAVTKAIFNKSFEDSLNKYPELEDVELSKNYRSQLGIVKFANTIQSIRYKYFDTTSRNRKLQCVRDDLYGITKDALKYVGFYSYDKHRDVILENLNNALIITSGDGDKDSLSNFPEISNDKIKLFTAVGTKGLEYDAVMLFNFSKDSAYKLFEKLLNGETLTASQSFEIAHFFTKLYIAVSRAKQQLFIVDSDESYNSFWKYFVEHDLWENNLIKALNLDEEKRQLVGHVTMGDIVTLPQRLSESYDPEELGRQAFEKAKGERSLTLMQDAYDYFMDANIRSLAQECDAYISLYKYDYEQAGDKFILLQEVEKQNNAIYAYWRGECWKKLLRYLMSRANNTYYENIILLVAKYMSKKIDVINFLDLLILNQADFQKVLTSNIDDIPIWKSVFDKLSSTLKTINKRMLSVDLLKNLDVISGLVSWYNDGMASLRAELYYAYANIVNRNMDKTNSKFQFEGYKQAIVLWEKIGVVNIREYFHSKKICAMTISEEIKWMNNLNEVAEIISKYGSVDIADSLTSEAANIVFTSFLKRDYSKAVTYPYPQNSQVKWNRLYEYDRTRFLVNVVLPNFTLDKYYFLADKSKEDCVFENRLPGDVFNMIFSLTDYDNVKKLPYWSYFTSEFKDNFGNRWLKNLDENKIGILNSISVSITSSNKVDKNLLFCFLDFLFDDCFQRNYKRAERYNRTLTTIFSQKDLSRAHFRMGSINKYFSASNFKYEDYIGLKNNICAYVEYYFKNIARLDDNSYDEVKAMLRAYEICIPYQGKHPDYSRICAMYKKCITNEKLVEIKAWMEQRLLFIQFMDEHQHLQASYNKLKVRFKENGYDLFRFMKGLSKEDAAMLVVVIHTCRDRYSYDATFMSAKLVYRYKLTRTDLKPYCNIDEFAMNIQSKIDRALKYYTKGQRFVNEYAIKILTYTWEAFFDSLMIAKNYDDLLDERKIIDSEQLSVYIKERALFHYSYRNPEIFNRKQVEYNMVIDREELSRYPIIEK